MFLANYLLNNLAFIFNFMNNVVNVNKLMRNVYINN